jgi:hypothetical protein
MGKLVTSQFSDDPWSDDYRSKATPAKADKPAKQPARFKDAGGGTPSWLSQKPKGTYDSHKYRNDLD